jgi:hypothetical protein
MDDYDLFASIYDVGSKYPRIFKPQIASKQKPSSHLTSSSLKAETPNTLKSKLQPTGVSPINLHAPKDIFLATT